jgi:hypothetical protein
MASFLEGLGVTEYDKNSTAAQEVEALTHEIMDALDLNTPQPQEAVA